MFLFAASRHCEARSSPGIICGQKYDNFGEMVVWLIQFFVFMLIDFILYMSE